jgi:mono/diheme cytochrome c family protein
MKTVITVLVTIAVLVLAVLAVIFSGIYDVAATSPDSGLIHWVLDTTRSRSVHRAAEGLEGKITVPDLADPARLKNGFVHYHAMCASCHSAPGVSMSEVGQGLNPSPPLLARVGAEDEPEELFWVIKNGVKMTGMPAFGVTHTDEDLWAIVAFLRKMGSLSSVEYQAMVDEAGLGAPVEAHEHGTEEETGEGHSHAPGTPPHEDEPD